MSNTQITNWTLEGCLAAIIVDQVQKRIMFTAFDITQLARSGSPNEVIPHQAVKDYVHGSVGALKFAGYQRTSITLRNGDKAFVYHPDGTDANNYQIPLAALPDPDVIDAEIEDEVPSAAASFINNVQGAS